jgi:hypothetical protein
MVVVFTLDVIKLIAVFKVANQVEVKSVAIFAFVLMPLSIISS